MRCVAGLALVVVLGLAADAEPPPRPPVFGESLWQSLPPTVAGVCVGPDGRVWRMSRPADPLATAADLQKAVEREFREPSPEVRGAAPILFEPGGRVWFVGWGFESRVMSGYDGTTWIHRPLQDQHVLIGRPPNHGRSGSETFNAQLGDQRFFVDTTGIDRFDGRTWTYHRLTALGPAELTWAERPMVQLEPDGKGLLALMRTGTTSALWRWRGEWTELPSPGNLGLHPLRFAPARDGIWLFDPIQGLFFQSFDPAATAPALLKRAAAADGASADRAAAALAGRWRSILPDVQAVIATASDRAVIERFQRVAAELAKGNTREVRVGGHAVRDCTNLVSLADGTILIAARHVTSGDGAAGGGGDGAARRPGVLLARPDGRVDLLDDPAVANALDVQAGGAIPLAQADGKIWLPGDASKAACLLDVAAGRIVATMPERAPVRLQAVTPQGTVFASPDASQAVVWAFTPGKPDTRPMLLADETTVRRGAIEINGVVVASDGAIFGVRRGQGLCRFEGQDWKPVGGAVPEALGIAWAAQGSDGALLIQLDRGFALRTAGDWAFAPDLQTLVKRHRDAVARCFRRSSGASGPVADSGGNIWMLVDGRLTVLIGDRWEDVTLALQATGRAANRGFRFLGGIGDGSKVYVSGLVGEVAADTVRFAPGPLQRDRDFMARVVREPGGALWVPVQHDQGSERLTEAGAKAVPDVPGSPLLVDDDGNVWIASSPTWNGLINELVVWRDGAIRARVPFPVHERDVCLLAAGPGRVLAWTSRGLQVITARKPADTGSHEVGPVMAVRSRVEPRHTVEPSRSRPIAVVGDRLLIVANPELRSDDCRLFLADLPAR